MGTNYYLYRDTVCPHCNNPIKDSPRHIGKSSGGWCFNLHIYPEKGIHTLEDWKALWNHDSVYIKDEYGSFIPKEELEETITERSWGDGFPLRNKVDGFHCVGHGSGTWDYIVGEFS